jgi:hypothetical protein
MGKNKKAKKEKIDDDIAGAYQQLHTALIKSEETEVNKYKNEIVKNGRTTK